MEHHLGVGHRSGRNEVVIGIKTLHHLIPELVPPIDRQYTIRFFFEHTTMSQGDQITFFETFPRLHHIARMCA
jgi:hypothetical protein